MKINMPIALALLCLVLVSSACNLPIEGQEDQQPVVPTEATTTESSLGDDNRVESTPTAAPTEDPFPDPVMRIVGDEEVVFDWTTDRCFQEHIPDLAVRAYRDASDQVQLITSHPENLRLVGPDLNDLAVDCEVIMSSDHEADPSQYNDNEWVASTYTLDGETVFALIHNEYQGHTHPGKCPSADYFSCWDNSITLANSTDGGDSYQEAIAPPGHLVARLPFEYQPDINPSGTRSPSNIIQGPQGYYYAFFNNIRRNTQEQSVCLMRTDDLADPKAWRFWNGEAFDGQFIDPYQNPPEDPAQHICPPLAFDDIGASLNESITYNTYLERFVLIGLSADQIDGREVWGIYYAFSDDLINWDRRKLLAEMPLPWTVEFAGSDLSILYPSLLDPASSSRNFETSGKSAYLYFTRNNHGHGSLDRDLIRVPVEFFPEP